MAGNHESRQISGAIKGTSSVKLYEGNYIDLVIFTKLLRVLRLIIYVRFFQSYSPDKIALER